MYQVTWIRSGFLFVVNTPNESTAVVMANSLEHCQARVWDVSVKGSPVML